ncbi:MAG: WYL domain-containing protein [Deltaproteobacteria bacterium]|nr:WYL domain-containing protein [Deltaproteobacteria bacterium]
MPAETGPRPEQPIAVNLARILFHLMTNPRGWRVDELKKELGISDRTYRKYRAVMRDHFEDLFDRASGGGSLITQVRDGDVAYLRLRDSEEPVEDHPWFFTRIATLQLARKAFGFLRGTDVGQQMEDQYLDFLSRMGDRVFVFRDLLRDMDRKVFYRPWAPKDYSSPERQRKLKVILRGLFYSKRLRLTYDSPGWNEEPSLVEPLTLMLWKSALYLIVRFKGKKKPYELAVDRISKVETTGEKFRYPSRETYSPEALSRGSFGAFHAQHGRPTEVELVFADRRWLKMDLRERRWHDTQEFEDLPDGRLRMTFTVRSMVEVWPWIRSFGDDVEVIRPDADSA